mgnify:CR=1 FL=1
MKIALGSDNMGYDLKEEIKKYLQEQQLVPVDLHDLGVFDKTPMDYPDIAEKVALAVAAGECERGILICGTGIGMAISANKVPGVRAAQAHDVYSAERARKSNDAQIITLGALVVGVEHAKMIISAWLPSEFAGGRKLSSWHVPRPPPRHPRL